jgi:putative isomerase
MDDSPMYDTAVFDPHTYTMNLNDVGLNSLYALDAECLASPAKALGEDADARRFADEYERMKHLIREKLWNERDGIYENRYWDGKFSQRLSPTNFYPLFAGIATPEQAIGRRLVTPTRIITHGAATAAGIPTTPGAPCSALWRWNNTST